MGGKMIKKTKEIITTHVKENGERRKQYGKDGRSTYFCLKLFISLPLQLIHFLIYLLHSNIFKL